MNAESMDFWIGSAPTPSGSRSVQALYLSQDNFPSVEKLRSRLPGSSRSALVWTYMIDFAAHPKSLACSLISQRGWIFNNGNA